MQRLKMLFAGMNLASLAFTALTIKSIVLTPTIADAIVFLCACGVYGYWNYLKAKKPDPVRINTEVKQELDNIKGALTALKLEKNLTDTAKRFF